MKLNEMKIDEMEIDELKDLFANTLVALIDERLKIALAHIERYKTEEK